MFFYELGQKCQFSRIITQQLFLQNYFKIGQTVEFDIDFLSFFNWLSWQPEFFMDSISFSYGWKRSIHPFLEHSYELFKIS